MFSTDRDRQIVLAVGGHRQLAAGHINDLFFHGLKSETPCKRALARLVERRYLKVIGRRPVLGNGFGSGQRVYGLGPEGWKLCGRTGKYQPQRTVHLHDLGIADAFAAVKQLEHQGTHRILGDSKEPDSWLKVKGVELRPDRYIELHRIGSKWKHAWWLEIDTGSENQTQLKNKMFNYYRARQVIGEHWDADEAGNDVELAEVVGPDSFPRVVFIVPDDDRLNEIRWLIGRGPDDAAELFDVVRHDEFSTWAEQKAR